MKARVMVRIGKHGKHGTNTQNMRLQLTPLPNTVTSTHLCAFMQEMRAAHTPADPSLALLCSCPAMLSTAAHPHSATAVCSVLFCEGGVGWNVGERVGWGGSGVRG